MSTPTKPERVEVGMRRRANLDSRDLFVGDAFTIVGSWTSREGAGWKYRYDDRPGSFYRDEAGILANSTLIAPAPATPGTATVTPGSMAADEYGEPVYCISCGGPKRSGQIYVCDDCCDHKPWSGLADEWNDGARDFPRRARGAVPAPKPPASPVGPPASCLMEQWDGATVTPRSALQAIQAKREPEPWVESCDLLHWLRDA